jgi:transposase-like protein
MNKHPYILVFSCRDDLKEDSKNNKTMTHLFRPEHLEAVCPSCRKKHEKEWKAEFWKHQHYKTLNCDCGYKISIPTDKHHSGHY